MSALTPIRVLGPQFAPYWHRPHFRYVDPVPGAEAGTPPAPGAPAPTPPADADLGFPKDTPVDQMTPEQASAYWKNQTKVQQKAREDAEKAANAYKKFGTVEEMQEAADAAETARIAALDDNQKAIEAAKAAARAEAAAEHGTKHLGTAVKGMLIALTKGASETFEAASSRVEGAIEFADLTKFIGDNGELDAAKVQTFATSIGSTDSDGAQPGGFQLFDAMQRQNVPAPGSTGSVAAIEQATYDRLTSKQ
jgi:hypothetical protein